MSPAKVVRVVRRDADVTKVFDSGLIVVTTHGHLVDAKLEAEFAIIESEHRLRTWEAGQRLLARETP